MAAPCTVTMEMITEATDFVRARYSEQPEIGICRGAGCAHNRYGDIPHFAQSTVHGHSGVLVLGRVLGWPEAGLRHCRAGFIPTRASPTCSAPSRCGVMAKLGVRRWSSDPRGRPLTAGLTRCRAFSPEVFGDRFVPMNNAYDKKLRDKRSVAPHRRLRYAGRAALRDSGRVPNAAQSGADVVGMSTVHETIVARQCKVRVIGFSIITNVVVVTDSDSELDQDRRAPGGAQGQQAGRQSAASIHHRPHHRPVVANAVQSPYCGSNKLRMPVTPLHELLNPLP
uniref:purine-nucleoside phosphorylase n=1 Tax=Macrostomum lignano TaxID=282301 RepID=A0A1I8FJC1_9PLAT